MTQKRLKEDRVVATTKGYCSDKTGSYFWVVSNGRFGEICFVFLIELNNNWFLKEEL